MIVVALVSSVSSAPVASSTTESASGELEGPIATLDELERRVLTTGKLERRVR